MNEKITIGSHYFDKAEIGYEQTDNKDFFVKRTDPNPEVIKRVERQRKYIKEVYKNIPTIVPRMKIIKFEQDGVPVFGEYTAKIDFRGFFTASTPYKNLDFLNFIVNQRNLQEELLLLIDATKIILNGKEGCDTLPEFFTWGNMGIDFENHIRIIDYELLPLFENKTDNSIQDKELNTSGLESLMFCLHYEYLFELQKYNGEDDALKRAGNKILGDPLYQKHLFRKYDINIAPEQLDSYLKDLNNKCGGIYINLPQILTNNESNSYE